MGPVTAVLYVIFMVIAHIAQIRRLHEVKDSRSIAMSYYLAVFGAVLLRLTTVGIVVYETMNVTAIALAFADTIVVISLIIILFQVFRYRPRKK